MSTRVLRTAGTAGAVALALATAPSALAARSMFGGSTRAGEPIVLSGDRAAGKLKSAVIAVEAKCDDGTRFPLSIKVIPTTDTPGFTPGPRDLAVSRNAKGKFAGEALTGSDAGDAFAVMTTKLAGKLKARRASGSLSLDVSIVDKQSNAQTMACHSGTVKWAATRAPGRVYGGSSSQEEPVVVRLDGKRKRVADVLAGWESSTCTPANFLRFGERFTDFPLRSGRFSDTWNESFNGTDGGKMNYAYEFAGKVARRSATGTLHVAVTGTDAAGATTLSCDTGGVTWKVTTG